MTISIISPIQSSLVNSSSAYRVWEPKSKKNGGQTLFFQHPYLCKWDWDVAKAWDGSWAAHTEEAITISHRNAPLAWVSAHPWASKYAWGVVDSFGGVNLYNLSIPLPLHKMNQSCGEELMKYMSECRVDPFYIKNVQSGVNNKWQWNSRIWVKTWRPNESFTGKFRCIHNPNKGKIHPKLYQQFQHVLKMYDVWN